MPDVLYIAIFMIIAAAGTFAALHFLPMGGKLLGHDRGRKFAVGSEVNVGKPTGVGFYFVIVFSLVALIAGEHSWGFIVSILLVLVSMVCGFLDDRSKAPWGEYIKGALDFGIAIIGAIVITAAYGSKVFISLGGSHFEIPSVIYAILAAVLFIVSINATNATDGVDGLSGSLTVLTLVATIIAGSIVNGFDCTKAVPGFILIAVLLAYLWFNHFPSKMLMGDAGSRAIGYFIAFYVMYMKIPFAYLIMGLPFLIDGGLSILKITIGRLTHKKVIILKNVTTPIHDHLKKRIGLSVPKTWAAITGTALVLDIIYIILVMVLN